jgi:hypothetical protein
MECWIDETGSPFGASLVGGMHVHLPIRFSDGTIWLARILRHNFTSFSDELSNEILISECATLKWLEKVEEIPSPRLHAYGLRGDAGNEVGVAFMLVDMLPGEPFNKVTATEAQRQKVYTGLGTILTALSRYPFHCIGSLILENDGSSQIGPVTGDRTGTLSRLGPFSNATDYYVALADEYLRLIADRQLFADYPSDAYLMFKHLRELASKGQCNGFEEALDTGPFFLKHMDDKGDHILVDGDFNITGVIDWSFARLVPAYEAFGPSLVTADMDALFSGQTGLSHDDQLLASATEAIGSPIARFARFTDRVRRFTFGIGMGMALRFGEALNIFRGIVATFNDDVELEWDKWRSEHLAKWADDQVLSQLVQSENAARVDQLN